MSRPRSLYIILTAGFGLVIFLLLFSELYQPMTLKEGMPSPYTIKAPKTIEYVDMEATEARKEKTRGEIEPIYRLDLSVEQSSLDKVSSFFFSLQNNDEVKNITINNEIIAVASKIDKTRIPFLSKTTSEIIRQLYANRIKEKDLKLARSYIFDMVGSYNDLTGDEKKVVSNLISTVLANNLVFDDKTTNDLRNKAASEIAPVVEKKLRGEIIVRDGEIVTNQQAKLLKELNFKQPVSLDKIFGLFLFSAILVIFLALYISKFQSDKFTATRLTVLLYLIIGFTLIIAKLFTPSISIYLIPILATVMLTSIIFSAQLAIVVAVFCSLFVSVLASSLEYMIFGLLASSFVVYLSQNVKERSNMVSAGIYASIASAAIAFILSLTQDKSLIVSASSMVWAAGGAGFSVVTAIGLLAFIEPTFQITTDFRLLDLANPNQPLLRELMIKAPGTYNHSIIVGNLADAAAQKLGANQLLARVGAYYHDIGKTKRPLFFIENNLNEKKIHENLNPNLSCMIIRSHVDEGLEIAKKYNLPKEIHSIIEQHHGTTVVSYFYELAKQNTCVSKEEIQEDSYRYPGRKPQSKEAAIVMLADAVEAAARTFSKPSINRYKQIAKKVIDGKLKDGQLDESDLTLGDLQKAMDCFASMLHSMYHQRIDYPEYPGKNTQSTKISRNSKVIEFKKSTLENQS